MTQWINPYLNFAGRTREAFTFYQSVFGGKVDFVTGQDFGLPEAEHDRIMHAHLETAGGWTFMASDGRPGQECEFRGFTLNVGIHGDELETARGYFDALAEGGQVGLPLEQQQWGDYFGEVTDAFGVTWSFNAGANQA